jgi:predicted RNase H-like HicB family nuclease
MLAVMPTIILLTEEALRSSDVANIRSLHGDDLDVTVLVPADTEQNVVTEIINHLSLFELKEAWDAITEKEDPEEARQEASEALEQTVAALEAAGLRATGTVVDDDPLPALTQAVTNADADEVIIVTRPHAVEDTFHADWASRARETLGVPVLHFYTGTNFLG